MKTLLTSPKRKRGDDSCWVAPRLRFGLVLFAIGLVVPSILAADEAPKAIKEEPITDSDREHWAFTPVKRPLVPQVKDESHWQRTPIDAFILQKLEAKKVLPQQETDKLTLLRRITYNLTGLPPTPEEIAAFEADDSPEAYERVVDRLLNSPQFGERWAQHWLDLARFAETDGFEHDKLRPNAWKYRDWVIEALNRDMPYDEFVQQQIAGDELSPGEESGRIATMFCLSGPDMPDINDQELRRHNLLNEMTATVGSVFMALQFGCAQCHDHKYDPISQADFYRLRAVFAPAVKLKRDQLVSVLLESSPEAPPDFFYIRGDVTRVGPQISPAFPRVVNAEDATLSPPTEAAKSTGRRTALAKWLTRREHPLTARVIVNRLWHHHFGRGLSDTPSDFGLVGSEPSHPELLDWLAMELMDHDWSLKHIHRLIVMSAVYRQRSLTLGYEQPKVAPELLASYPRRRLEAEAVRDAMLAASGNLNFARGGPGIMPPLPKEVQKTLLGGHWRTTENAAEHHRRSVYVFARRNLRLPILEVFDRADPNQSCPARHESTTALQSLMMLNSDFSITAAELLAERVLADAGGEIEDALVPLYLRVYGRRPTEQDLVKLQNFLRTQTRRLTDERVRNSERAAFIDLCWALLNTNEFLYLD